jgi:D-alanyl-D-alanine carboxypeptidase/D-alanyl-D-alanine-endopeptidase (penicillin-binding protein 4)
VEEAFHSFFVSFKSPFSLFPAKIDASRNAQGLPISRCWALVLETMDWKVINYSRRWILGAMLSGVAAPVLGNAPTRSPVPPMRPGRAAAAAPQMAAPSAEALVAQARLRGTVSYVVADARTGAVLESRGAEDPLPPASVIKAATAIYAIETLGAEHRFLTRLMATGPMQNGRVQGDLVLVGGGDPTLTTDHLGALVAALRDRGVREVSGRFLVHGGVLPAIATIDPDQPEHVGYSPAISGIALNFNRVHFEWRRAGNGFEVTMDARDSRFQPRVTSAEMRVASRDLPVYTYSSADGVDRWTVASTALGNGGSRWLPVRNPEAYAGDVFRTLARSYGLVLPASQATRGAISGTVLAEHRSEPLTRIVGEMLRFSTNSTAEMLGLAATLARGGAPRSLADSAQAMAAWLQARYGVQGASLRDHSGLSGDARLSAQALAAFFVAAHGDGRLPGLLREFQLRDARGNVLPNHPVKVLAKTGTLNFVSALGGYFEGRGGRPLAFAILTADLGARATLTGDARERPAGGREWTGRARALQQALLERWAALPPS